MGGRWRTGVPDELRLAEAGPGAEHGDRGALLRLASVDDYHVVGHRQRRHRVPHSHKVVEHLDTPAASAQHAISHGMTQGDCGGRGGQGVADRM